MSPMATNSTTHFKELSTVTRYISLHFAFDKLYVKACWRSMLTSKFREMQIPTQFHCKCVSNSHGGLGAALTFANPIQTGGRWEGNLLWENASIKLADRQAHGALSWLMINVAGPIRHRWCHIWAGGSALCKNVGGAKPLKQASKGKFFLDLCFGSCLHVPTLLEFLS